MRLSVEVLQVENKITKVVRLPSFNRGLETEASRIHDGDDGHGHAAVRKIGAASASVVLDEHAEEVLILDALAVAGRLHAGHHEGVLLGDRLLHALLLFHLGDLVLDLREVEFHISAPVALASIRSLNRPVHQASHVHMGVVISRH